MRVQLCIILMVMFSCCYHHSDYTGTYIRFAKHEFGTEYDTLCIYQQTGQRYIVERKWQYIRILDGKQLEPEYKVTRTTAYDDAGVLKEEKTSATYVTDPKQRVIYNGTVKYKKQ